MTIRDAVKIFGINIVCIVLALAGIIGIKNYIYTDNVVLISISIVAVIVSAIAAFYSNIKIFSKTSDIPIVEMSDRELENVLEKYSVRGCERNKNAAQNMIRQLKTFENRKKVLMDLLNSYFSDDDNYFAYTNLIDKANCTLKDNINNAIKRISIFDNTEYNMLKNNMGAYSEQIRKSKLEQYENHLRYVEKMVNSNDLLIIEFDNLITEVSRLNESSDANDLSLLKDTVNAMKQLHFTEDEEMVELKNKYEEEA